jgi:crossover junction endodeoxyribonuclease RuvC
MNILGIDPGINGAFACIHKDVVSVHDLPTAGDGKHRIIATPVLAHQLRQLGPTFAVIERVHAMPNQGVSSSFRFGQAFGAIEGVLGALGVSLSYVTPAQWKRALGLSADKDEARLRAIQLYPAAAPDLQRRKDTDRAEALLIARWASEQLEHPSAREKRNIGDSDAS